MQLQNIVEEAELKENLVKKNFKKEEKKKNF